MKKIIYPLLVAIIVIWTIALYAPLNEVDTQTQSTTTNQKVKPTKFSGSAEFPAVTVKNPEGGGFNSASKTVSVPHHLDYTPVVNAYMGNEKLDIPRTVNLTAPTTNRDFTIRWSVEVDAHYIYFTTTISSDLGVGSAVGTMAEPVRYTLSR